MWGKLRNLSKIILLTSSLVLLSSFSCLAAGAYTPLAEQKTTITMSLNQWNELKQELTEQNLELEQLRQKLKMLKSISSEQMQLLENLQSELNATRQSLMNANVSLTECRNELEKSKASLETLKQEIKQMEHKQVVLRRQRDVWAAIAALSLGGVIARR